MTAEQQNQVWASLPKEVRTEVRRLWELDTLPIHPDYDPNSVAEGAAYILTEIFGHGNLTSNTEPEEVLVVQRKKVIELNSRFNKYLKESTLEQDADFYKGELNALNILFSDKCPDTESEQTTVQVEKPTPRFKVGDNVWYGTVLGTINKIKEERAYLVHSGGGTWVYLLQLKPHIEPHYKFNIGDKVIFRNNKIKVISNRYGNPYNEEANYTITTIDGQSPLYVSESDLQPYTEPEKTNDNMAEKESGKEDNSPTMELDLYSFLKGCEGMKIYNPNYGEMTFEKYDKFLFFTISNTTTSTPKIIPTETGYIGYYPSKEAFLKYPLDAKRAWSEWAESRKQKVECTITDVGKHWELKVITTFGTVKEAEQMADNIRLFIQSFNDRHNAN